MIPPLLRTDRIKKPDNMSKATWNLVLPISTLIANATTGEDATYDDLIEETVVERINKLGLIKILHDDVDSPR